MVKWVNVFIVYNARKFSHHVLYLDYDGKNVGNLKEELADLCKTIPKERQILVNFHNYEKLLFDDSMSVENYFSPLSKSSLDLLLFSKIQPYGGIIEIKINLFNDYWNCRHRTIFIIQAEFKSTILQLRQLIDEKLGVPPHRQQLVVLLNNPVNTTTIEVPITEACDLLFLEDVLPNNVQYKIHLTKRERELWRCSTVRVQSGQSGELESFLVELDGDTVFTLMKEFTERTGEDGNMCVLCGDGGQALTEGNQTLSACGVEDGDTLIFASDVLDLNFDFDLDAPVLESDEE